MVLGPRFVVEAGFIIAVAVVAGLQDLGTWQIIGVVAGACIIVAIVEIAVWHRNSLARRSVPATQPVVPTPEAMPVVSHPEPTVPLPDPVPVRVPEPPQIAAAPPPPAPVPDPEHEPKPEQEPAISYFPVSGGPREWNLWDLERLSRDHASDDVAQNEERAYLLIYLREFAGSDGTLPADFDGLVRDAFGDLLRVAAT